jgi:hypothetical protein
MGNDLNKDKNVQVFLTLEKLKYYAGEAVNGAVHIVCLQPRPYNFIDLRITGQEHVRWSRKQGKHTHVYTNTRDTYFGEFKMAELGMGIQPGHYSYPFSFVLPIAFPSSLFMDGSNYIRYELWAVVMNSRDRSEDQIFKR